MIIVEIMLPIILISLFGYVIARKHMLSPQQCDVVSRCTFYIFIPSLLFLSSATAEFSSPFNWLFFISYYLGVVLVFIASCLFSRVYLGMSQNDQGAFAVACSYSNTTIVGIPVCLYVVGEKAITPLFILISVHTLLVFTMGLLVSEWSSNKARTIYVQISFLVKSLVFNPIIVSLLLGSAVNISGISLNLHVESTLGFISQAALPLSLFVLGSSLNQYGLYRIDFSTMALVVFKLMILPLAVWWLSFYVFSVDIMWASVALLISAMPVGINAYFFSAQHAKNKDVIGSSILISTLLSIVTLSLAIQYVHLII